MAKLTLAEIPQLISSNKPISLIQSTLKDFLTLETCAQIPYFSSTCSSHDILIKLSGMVVHDCLGQEFIALSEEEEEGHYHKRTLIAISAIPGIQDWMSASSTPSNLHCHLYEYTVLDGSPDFKVGELLTLYGYLDSYSKISTENSQLDFTALKIEILPSILSLINPLLGCTPSTNIRDQIIEYFTIITGSSIISEKLFLSILAKLIIKSKSIHQEIDNLSNFRVSIDLRLNTVKDSSASSQFISEYIRTFKEAVGRIFPAVQMITVNRSTLETDLFVARYDSSSTDPNIESTVGEDFTGGVSEFPKISCLQVVNGTLLMLDETGMVEGALSETAVNNLNAVHSLVTRQVSLIDVGYMIEIPVVLPIISIALNSKSLSIPNATNLKIPLDSFQVSTLEGNLSNFLQSNPLFIENARSYFLQLYSVNSELPESLAKEMESSFVNARQSRSSKGKPTADDFHMEIFLTKLIAVSHVEGSVQVSHWEAAKALLIEASS